MICGPSILFSLFVTILPTYCYLDIFHERAGVNVSVMCFILMVLA